MYLQNKYTHLLTDQYEVPKLIMFLYEVCRRVLINCFRTLYFMNLYQLNLDMFFFKNVVMYLAKMRSTVLLLDRHNA
jgi:hypothetical protein